MDELCFPWGPFVSDIKREEKERKQISTFTFALLNLRMPLLESPCPFSPPSTFTLHSAVTSHIKPSISFAGSDVSTSAAKTLQDDLQLGKFFEDTINENQRLTSGTVHGASVEKSEGCEGR